MQIAIESLAKAHWYRAVPTTLNLDLDIKIRKTGPGEDHIYNYDSTLRRYRQRQKKRIKKKSQKKEEKRFMNPSSLLSSNGSQLLKRVTVSELIFHASLIPGRHHPSACHPSTHPPSIERFSTSVREAFINIGACEGGNGPIIVKSNPLTGMSG